MHVCPEEMQWKLALIDFRYICIPSANLLVCTDVSGSFEHWAVLFVGGLTEFSTPALGAWQTALYFHIYVLPFPSHSSIMFQPQLS